MALTDESGGMVMPVAPAYGGMGGGFGFGGDWAWILLLLVLFGGGNFGGFGGGDFYPWMNNSNQISDGFRDSMLNTSITSIGDKLTSGQMDAMQNTFALQNSLSTCCCENRLATAQTQAVIQSEGASTRAAIQSQTQAILDKMCQQEIDALKAQNVALQNQVNMLNLSASQTAQTAALIADNTAQTQYIVNRVSPYPVPAYVVANPVTPV